MTFRMYVDEVGNHHMANLDRVEDPNHRFLSLTGVMMSLDHARDYVHPRLEGMKAKHFRTHHPDHPVVLHRKEVMQKTFPFDALRDDAASASFDGELLDLLGSAEYSVVTVVIDKVEHDRRYKLAEHPYHFCMDVLVERYVQWLESFGAKGDVMFECRGKAEDRALTAEFGKVVGEGSRFVSRERFAARLTRTEPLMRNKTHNIAGLQIADIVAHPSYSAMRCVKEGTVPKQNFGAQVVDILEREKYRRSGVTIDGYGRKWLPG